MLSRTRQGTGIGFMAVVLAVLLTGCLNDNPTAPLPPSSDATVQTAAPGGRSSDGAPGEGIVVEGVSVPGIALGFTRAQVEDAYGDPEWCQSVVAGDHAHCSFPVSGGGQVDVLYRGADGGNAANSRDDVVHNIRWHEQVSGWTTTAGVNTTLAAEDPANVIAAYPDANITYNQFGSIYRVVDYPQGIEIIWAPDFYTGITHVNMAISAPSPSLPLPENLTRVTDIDLTTEKVRGRRQVSALVRVQNDQDLAAPGATVFASWTSPDGSTQAVEDATSNSGYAHLEIVGGPRGTYTFTIEDVVLEGYAFDGENSVLSANIDVK